MVVVAKKHHELYEQLGSIVGAKYVSDDLAVLLTYTKGIDSFPATKPQGVVVRPGSVGEVVELVRLANQTRTPLIPMGGKAALTGLAPGQPGRGIIVDMKRMDKVIEIDEVNMAVTAQCGITLGELASKVNEEGWDILTAQMPHYVSTLGGQISGYTSGGWSDYVSSIGFNWHYILGMKVVMPDGSVVDTGTGEGGLNTYRGQTFARAMHGPDLTGMFIGDGGMFGIKVEATLRMFHPPKFQKGGMRCWDNLDEAYQALYELWEIDPFLYVQPCAYAMILMPEAALIVDAEPTWIFSWKCIGNSEEEIELKVKTTEAICAKHGGRAPEPALAALDEGLLNQPREMGKLATLGLMPYFDFHTSRRDLLEAYKWTREFFFNAMRERGIDVTKVKFLGGIFPTGLGCGLTAITPLFDQNDKELHRAIHEALLECLEQGIRRGYVTEGTQSHAARLKAKQWTPEYYNYVLNLKKFLDPNNIINPGIYFM